MYDYMFEKFVSNTCIGRANLVYIVKDIVKEIVKAAKERSSISIPAWLGEERLLQTYPNA
jgi:hypothetical protein